MTDRVRVSRQDSRMFRAVTFLPHGQRCELWLPAGLYEFTGECNLTDGNGGMSKAEQLVACGDGSRWYVDIETAERLHGWAIQA